jgi:hypothetical protein
MFVFVAVIISQSVLRFRAIEAAFKGNYPHDTKWKMCQQMVRFFFKFLTAVTPSALKAKSWLFLRAVRFWEKHVDQNGGTA